MNTITRARNILETSLNTVDDAPSDYRLSELKGLISEIVNSIESLETDFSLDLYGGDVRIICEDAIDEIQQDELESDLYVLGCFNAEFIANNSVLPLEMVVACQEAEAFEAIGKGILALGAIEAIQRAYCDEDGYGNHFNHYDGGQDEVDTFLIFRTN